MKKLLLTFISAAVVAGVTAQPLHLIPKDEVKLKVQMSQNSDVYHIDLGSSVSTRVEEGDLLGNWTFYMGDSFMDGSNGEVVELPYEATLQEQPNLNLIVFQTALDEPEYMQPPMAAIFDEDENILTFPNVNFGEVEGYYMFQYTGIYNWDDQTLNLQPLDGAYDPETGELTFPEDAVIAWPAFNDPDGEDQAGWFWIYFIYEAQQDDVNGVESILDNFNGEPVYYNLHGLQVRNPQKGEILIEKRGKTSHKVVF